MFRIDVGEKNGNVFMLEYFSLVLSLQNYSVRRIFILCSSRANVAKLLQCVHVG